MKNPLNHDAIMSGGLKGLGDTPTETLAAYVYYIETLTVPQINAIDVTLPIHDRLVEATLIIFDTLLSDKLTLNRLYPDVLTSPCILKNFIPMTRDFFIRMFIQLELAPDNLTSKARLHMYTVYFNHWFRVWLNDETPDQSDTMAAIDQNLRKLREWKELITSNISF